MPCEDRGRQTTDAELRNAGWVRRGEKQGATQQRLNDVTAMLCEVMRCLTGPLRANLLDSVPGLRKWYDEHLKGDEEAEARRRALAKLTPEERKLLRIDGHERSDR